MTDAQRPWTAVVLSGGRSRRLEGSPKHAVRVGGTTLLERTLAAVSGASQIVIVGDAPGVTGAQVVREDPPFSGPAAAIGAALPHVTEERVAVVACDHPFLAEAINALMSGELDDVDGIIAVDTAGRRQNLLFTARRSALVRAVEQRKSLVDVAVHELVAGLSFQEMPVSERSLLDIDTWEDHAKLEEIDGGTG